MFNCGILAVEVSAEDLDRLFALTPEVRVDVDVQNEQLTATGGDGTTVVCSFTLNPFDRELVGAGGWLAYADRNY